MTGDQGKYINLLWHTFLDGDDHSFALIYRQFAPDLLGYGVRFNIGDDLVEDALQEVFIDLYLKRNLPGLKIENLKAYLFKALKNNILKKIVREKKTGNANIDGVDECLFEPEYCFQDQLIKMEIDTSVKEKLRKAIINLSSKQKEIIYLRFEEELEYEDISSILNISVESARKQLYRALKNLRGAIGYQILSSLFIFFKKNREKLSIFFTKHDHKGNKPVVWISF
ncbi:MAG: sigma-70 family RNA polymerase sigma factor [Prolixibacteraceae bacterium]|jgi:RNA polymerase sigma factor (sigma-70 family)|nr:sigma-70 family RNA polymerase sigma factor [Prolixibacteraceae bacterium]